MRACRILRGMQDTPQLRRTRIAELRAAVIRAHPDHGGTTESLQAALVALRTELSRPPMAATAERRSPRPAPAPRPSQRPAPMQGPFIRSAVSLGKAVFWVYGVGMPMALALALLLARATAALLN